MGKRILILDDDADFNSLLTDIFSQASYEVTSERDPERALALAREFQYDLVVTDQQMPGITGEVFIRELKEIQPGVPVIMVSGYLDNDTIRDLIREGVGGVFLKPLNVFSLLKRTAKLLEKPEAGGEKTASPIATDDGASDKEFRNPSLPFDFRSFPCKDARSQEFAQKLYSMRTFRTALALAGNEGTHFARICKDIQGFDLPEPHAFLMLDNAHVSQEALQTILTNAEQEKTDRLTLVVLELAGLQLAQQKLLHQLAKKDGPFKGIKQTVRFIFCLPDGLDNLYDKGVLDEGLYLLMSVAEVAVPPLSKCRDDIPLMAQQVANEEAARRGMTSPPRLDTQAKNYLRDHEWPGQFAQLRDLVSAAVGRAKNNAITRAILEKSESGAAAGPAAELRASLEALRGEYVRAVLALSDGDEAKAQQILAAEPALVQALAAK